MRAEQRCCDVINPKDQSKNALQFGMWMNKNEDDAGLQGRAQREREMEKKKRDTMEGNWRRCMDKERGS